jgi:mannose-6-phosphate isomerase-like protein (cupin superfamily)
MDWYQAYGERNVADGVEGRLVTMRAFNEPWDSWEVHPHGEELVVCTEGPITLDQESDEEVPTSMIRAGEAAVNPPGVWHTADFEGTATALFITAEWVRRTALAELPPSPDERHQPLTEGGKS